MRLEAEPANCCSTTCVLKLDSRPVGKFDQRFFSEGLDLALTGRRRLRFEKLTWLSSHFVLRSEESEAPLAEAEHGGMFTSSWDLRLSVGSAKMRRDSWFSSGYAILQQGEELARVDRIGYCSRGWVVNGRRLTEEDLLLIGLVYHIIQRRQAAQAGGAAAGGS